MNTTIPEVRTLTLAASSIILLRCKYCKSNDMRPVVGDLYKVICNCCGRTLCFHEFEFVWQTQETPPLQPDRA